MTNTEKVYRYVASRAPRRVTNAELREFAGVHPHPQVFKITQRLLNDGRIRGQQYGKEWQFWIDGDTEHEPHRSSGTERSAAADTARPPATALTPVQFEGLAVDVLSRRFDTQLAARSLPDVPKRFDLVSEDGTIVGDAKFFSMVRGEAIPPAKFSVIAEYTWLLEKTGAKHRFLVFGNDVRVPEEWLRRYGHLVEGVEFLFLDNDGVVRSLEAPR